MTAPIVVLGLGNVLLRDDGVGVHAVRRLMDEQEPGCIAAEIGTRVLDALDLVEGAGHVIALDAVEAGHPPGTVLRFTFDEAPRRPPSSRDLGLAGVLRLIPGGWRPPVTVLGVQPARIEVGIGLSETVEAALPRLVDATRREVRRIRCERSAAPSAAAAVVE